MSRENLVDIYWTELSQANNPQVVMVKFYSEIFEVPFNKNFISRFGSLIKMYGRENVFFAVLDTSEMGEVRHENYPALVNYFCKKREENRRKTSNYIDLSDYTDQIEQVVKKVLTQRIEILGPFDNE